MFFIATKSVKMADTLVLRALKGQPQTLNLSSKNLSNVPKAVGKLYRLHNLQLKNNKIVKLPKEFTSLTTVSDYITPYASNNVSFLGWDFDF